MGMKPVDIPSSRCSLCEQVKPLPEFRACARYKSGVLCYCRECERVLRSQRRDKLRNTQVLEAAEKCCTGCQQVKPLTCFDKGGNSNDGRMPRCKGCRKAERVPNKAKRAAYNAAHREVHSAKQRERRARNPEHHNVWYRAWYAGKGRPIMRANNSKRRALKKGSQGSYTAHEWKQLCEQHGNTCARCGCSGPLTVDHIVPLTKGGSNFLSNLQPLCRPCNSSKGNREVVDYRNR